MWYMFVMLAFERLKPGVCCEFQARLSYLMVRLYLNKPKNKKKEEEAAKEEEEGEVAVVAAAWKSVPEKD